jgi:transcriptional regulator with XRE-family HTH domain
VATAEIDRTTGEEAERDSTTFRVLRAGREARIRSVEPGQDLGTALRRARRRRHVSLEQASRQTRISERYLRALERGAPLEDFPAPMFARAFLREYAKFLRLDPDPLLHLLAPYQPPPVAPSLAVLSRSAPRPVKHRRILVLTAAAVLGVLLVLGSDDPLRAPDAPEPAAIADVGSVSVPADTDVAGIGAPTTGLTADLTTTARTWLRVTVDGEVIFEGIATKGWARSFSGTEKIELLIGNAAAVDLTLSGKPQGSLGGAGAVRELLITPGTDGPHVRVIPRNH